MLHKNSQKDGKYKKNVTQFGKPADIMQICRILRKEVVYNPKFVEVVIRVIK